MAKISIIIEDDYELDGVSVYAEIEKEEKLEAETTQAESFAQGLFDLIYEGADSIIDENGNITVPSGGTHGKH